MFVIQDFDREQNLVGKNANLQTAEKFPRKQRSPQIGSQKVFAQLKPYTNHFTGQDSVKNLLRRTPIITRF